MKVRFELHSRIDRAGRFQVFAVYSHRQERYRFSVTGVKCKPTEWDRERRRVRYL